MKINLKKRMLTVDLQIFADQLKELQRKIGFKVSSRGWCYQLESENVINKSQFDKVETLINKCRRSGLLPIDFVAEEEGRQFSCLSTPTNLTPKEYLKDYIEAPLFCSDWYTPDWHEGEEYYIQMIVEKIDLKTLFEPVCEKYHIPIATSKGWSSMLQRAQYARRYKKAEDKGMRCVLLYCGDHDPDGLRISDFIKNNLTDLNEIRWGDGTEGYDPEDLVIRRFGLDYDFIEENNLTWIDNLITGSGRNLASPLHKNYRMNYVQNYIRNFGVRKCEANAIIPMPDVARKFVEEVIQDWLGEDALDRFYEKRQNVRDQIQEIISSTGLDEKIEETLELL